MRAIAIGLMAVTLAGCSMVREDASERRYHLCMHDTLGHFSNFQSPDARLKASESCQRMANNLPPAPAAD